MTHGISTLAFTAGTIVAGNLTAPELVIGHDSHDWSVRIKPSGAVEINPALSLDEAALAFWRAVERMGFADRKAP